MGIYKVSVLACDLNKPESVSFEFHKLGQVVYNGHHRDVYVSAPNEKQAIKKGIKFIKKQTMESTEDE